MKPSRTLTVLLLLLLLAGGCARGPVERTQPAGAPAGQPDKPVSTTTPTGPGTSAEKGPVPPEPLTVKIGLSGTNPVQMDGFYIAVPMPTASFDLHFSAPMDREGVEQVLLSNLNGLEHRFTWVDGDTTLFLTVTLTHGATFWVDPGGLPDRWGRKTPAGTPQTYRGELRASLRAFTYIPATDEAHPGTLADGLPGVFVEGLPHPEVAGPLLLWTRATRAKDYTVVYRPFFLYQGRLRPLDEAMADGSFPRFYGWLRHTDGFVFGVNNRVFSMTDEGKLLREFPLPQGGIIHGGAVSAKSGLVALFLSGADQQVRLVVWNPESGEQKDCGVIEPRRALPGADFPYMWMEADWSADDTEIAFADMPGEPGTQGIYRFDLATGKKTQVAKGYRRPRFSPATADLLLAERADLIAQSVILDRSGQVVHTLPGKTWFWHLSGEALDRTMAAPNDGLAAYSIPIQNYRLADRRLLQRGIGLVIGHGPGPGGGSLYILVENKP